MKLERSLGNAAPPGGSRARAGGARMASFPLGRARTGTEAEVVFASEIVAAHEEVRALIDAAFSGIAARGPDLVTLRSDLRRCLDRLLEAWLAVVCERDAIDALVPFVFFVDEQVERSLALSTELGSPSFVPLQRDLFPDRRAEGGDVFFERAEELLEETPPRPLVLASYVFCLKAGFRGRLADEPEEAAEEWIRALSARLPKAARGGDYRRQSWRAPRRAATYWGVAIGAVLTFHFLVSLWAYLR